MSVSVGSTPSLNFIGDTVGDTAPHSMSEMRGIRFASSNSPITGAISLSNFRNQVLTRRSVQQAKITASDKQTDDYFGYRVSISGDGLYAIVGAPPEDTGGDAAGAAYILKRTDSSWSQQAKIQASDKQAIDYFGISVSISGDGSYAIVGAEGEGTGGSAYIFNRTDSSWSQQAKIRSSDIQDYDRFGYSVAISGDGLYAIVGAPGESTLGIYTGAAYMFKRTNSLWSQQAKVLKPTASDQDFEGFGHAVSISGDGSYAIVGITGEAAGATSTGAAYIYTRTDSSWAKQARIVASDRQAYDLFGYGVSISGDGSYAIVGAVYEDTGGNQAGAAYIFNRTNSSWSQQAKIQASDKQADDFFGENVSISEDGSYAIVGAAGEDSYRGAAYVFKRTNSSWSQQDKITASDKQAGDYFGYDVAISGDSSYIIAGAVFEGTRGAAYTFINGYYI